MVNELELLTENDMLEFDKKNELISLTFDFIFKGLFVENLPLLKKFLLAILDTEVDIDKDCSVTLLNNELPKENKKEYKKDRNYDTFKTENKSLIRRNFRNSKEGT